ncbi:unnamed protein product [Moneuplotes crassus]|uniref:Uncharacterized protein n=1 Tax=Euplotes crassus TaxID=5936 RepID=A0AAD1XFB5_EUPCR|nr:unnamed protein product [Moneuplotes crassus]
MSSLIPRFLACTEQLSLNKVPATNSGRPYRKLKFNGEKYEKLSDTDIKELANSLEKNTKFKGELLLKNNSLTDLSALYLTKAMETFKGITKLSLKGNGLGSKAGEFIGDWLLDLGKTGGSLEALDLGGNNFEETGIRRIILGVARAKTLRKVDIGTISDFGLVLLAEELTLFYGEEADPQGVLEKIKFKENKDKEFSSKARESFIESSENFSPLIKCGDDELEYYNKDKKIAQKEFKKFKKRNLVMDQKSLIKSVVKSLENKRKPDKIAIQKYFKNTFGDLLNDAMYELTRKQEKFPENDEYFTIEGSLIFVGEFLLENLPDHEVEHLKEEKESKGEKNETDV